MATLMKAQDALNKSKRNYKRDYYHSLDYFKTRTVEAVNETVEKTGTKINLSLEIREKAGYAAVNEYIQWVKDHGYKINTELRTNILVAYLSWDREDIVIEETLEDVPLQ